MPSILLPNPHPSTGSPGAASMALAAGCGTWVSAKYVAFDIAPEDLRKILAVSIGVAALSMLRK